MLFGNVLSVTAPDSDKGETIPVGAALADQEIQSFTNQLRHAGIPLNGKRLQFFILVIIDKDGCPSHTYV